MGCQGRRSGHIRHESVTRRTPADLSSTIFVQPEPKPYQFGPPAPSQNLAPQSRPLRISASITSSRSPGLDDARELLGDTRAIFDMSLVMNPLLLGVARRRPLPRGPWMLIAFAGVTFITTTGSGRAFRKDASAACALDTCDFMRSASSLE